MNPKLYQSTFKMHPARSLVAVLFVALIAFGDLAVFAQEPQPATAPAQETQDTPKIPNDQLDSLVAPIALYPDPLLSQVLVASTYPLELVQLQQWLDKTGKMLNEKAVTEAVQKENWDPSVQAMAVLPAVVKRLVENIKWTQDLGNAFLAQQSDVMDAVQRMRVKAKDVGKLQSSEQIKVESQQVESKTVVVIEQASPEVVYVPSYDPAWIWGAMAYPYPPFYGGYIGGAAIWWGAGIAIGGIWGGGGWGWGAGWGNNNININVNNRFVNHYNNTNINRGGNRINSGNWQHNPQHRGGAPYGNRATAQRFGNSLGNRQAGNLGSGPRAGNMDLSGMRGGGQNLGANRGNLGGGGGRPQAGNMNLSGLSGRGGSALGGDRIGSRDVSRGSGVSNRGSFGGSGSFGGGAARASSMRGSSSMGGGGGGFGGGRGGGGFGGGRGGGGRGGGRR